MLGLLTTILSGLLGLTTLGPRAVAAAIVARGATIAAVVPKPVRQSKSGTSRMR